MLLSLNLQLLPNKFFEWVDKFDSLKKQHGGFMA